MKINYLFVLVALFIASFIRAQVPSANFSINPNPICTGSTNVLTITDLSTGNPTSWSYTVTPGIPGPLTQTFSAQNPTVSFQIAAVYSVYLVATNSNGSSTRAVQTLTVLNSPNGQVTPTAVATCTNGSPVTMSVLTGGPGGGGATTFSWSTGATTSVIAVSPAVTTVYTCVISANNGCKVTRTTTVSVGNPTISITASPINICPGYFSTLTANSSGSAPFTYTWSTTANTKSEMITTPGVYNVTVTTGNGCIGTKSISIGTSTALTASIAASNSVICRGNNLLLTGAGGTTYSWSTGAVAGNINVNPTSTTIYSVIALTGTCQGTASFTVQVNQTPTIIASASPTMVCSGNSTTLTASGASSFTWTPGAIVASSIVVSPTVAAGNGLVLYSVTGSNTACPSRNAAITLMVSYGPTLSVVASPTSVCAGEPMALSASGASTYSWSNGVNQGLQIVYPQLNATYTLTGADANGCTTAKVVTLTVDECAGLVENQKSRMGVYPNPSNGTFKITGTAGSFVITDLTGKTITTGLLSAETNCQTEITLPVNGVYFIQHANGSVLKVVVAK